MEDDILTTFAVLKEDKNTGKLYRERIKAHSFYPEIKEKVYVLDLKNSEDPKDIQLRKLIDIFGNDHPVNSLISYSNYWSSAYDFVEPIDLSKDLEDYIQKINSVEDEDERAELVNRNNYPSYNTIRFDYYNHVNTVQQLKLDDVKSFSHSLRGKKIFISNYNNDFSVHISSNFGFGGSSYFFLIIEFKNIKILPYSKYIRYRIAQSSEFIRYTMEYPVRFVQGANKRIRPTKYIFYNRDIVLIFVA